MSSVTAGSARFGLGAVPFRKHRRDRFRRARGGCEAAAKSAGGASRRDAHTAMARTSGEGSPSSRLAAGQTTVSPQLPMAISTLRTNRSRPSRLIGLPEKMALKVASSSAARSASRGAVNSARGRKACSAVWQCELVPGADREAIVAAVDPVAHGLAEFGRDVALVLDGEVRDAAPGIEPVGGGERVGRADVEAAAAGAATVGLGVVGREVEGGEQFAEEEPRAVAAGDEVGVLALPADARAGLRAASPSQAPCPRRVSPRRRTIRTTKRASRRSRPLITLW